MQDSNLESKLEYKMKSLSYSYRSLAWTSSVVALMSLCFFGLDVVLATQVKSIASGGVLAEAVILSYLYLFIVLGGLSSTLILLVSIKVNSFNTSAFTVNTTQQYPLVSQQSQNRQINLNQFNKNQLIFAQTQVQTVEFEMDRNFNESGDLGESRMKVERNNSNVGSFEVDLNKREEVWEKEYPYLA